MVVDLWPELPRLPAECTTEAGKRSDPTERPGMGPRGGTAAPAAFDQSRSFGLAHANVWSRRKLPSGQMKADHRQRALI